MSFGGYIGTTGTKGPLDILGMRKHHNKWLAEFSRSNEETLEQVGKSAVHFAATTKAVKRRTGELARGWKLTRKRSTRMLSISLVSSVKHALFQERGTGIFGPTGRYIVPKRAALLRWKSPTGKWCSAKRVKGVPAKFIGKHGAFEAWGFGKAKFTRSANALARRF